MQKLINFVKGEIIAGAAILSIFGDKPSGPQDFLTFKPISYVGRRYSSKEKSRLNDLFLISTTLGWLSKSSIVRPSSNSPMAGVKNYSLTIELGSETTLPSSVRWIVSVPALGFLFGGKGLIFFQNKPTEPGDESVTASKQKSLTLFLFKDVTLLHCSL